MMYRHTARFQIVLRDALRLQSLDRIPISGKDGVPYSDEAMLQVLRIEKGRTTLTKFRNAEFPPFEDDATGHLSARELKGGLRDERLASALWEKLSASDHIRRALSAGKITHVNRKQLFSERQFANTIASFFDTHESQIKGFCQRGLVDKKKGEFVDKEWICFKNSWQRPGYIVKSVFSFTNESGEYFSVSDDQRDTGRFSTIDHHVVETSTGIAVSKSEKLWCFMREAERDQPRIFCFFRPLASISDTIESGMDRGGERLSVLYGHVMETERRVRGDFYGTFVVLISKEMDRKEWVKKFGRTEKYNEEAQRDVFPGPDAKPEIDRQPSMKFFIPDFVIAYLKDGKARP